MSWIQSIVGTFIFVIVGLICVTLISVVVSIIFGDTAGAVSVAISGTFLMIGLIGAFFASVIPTQSEK